jgi:hypothetical protein
MNTITLRKVALVLISVTLGLSLIGCASKPSESAGKEVLIKDLARNDAIKVNGFKKTNGIEKTVDGVKKYTMEFEADIEYVKKGQAIGGGVLGLLLLPPVQAGTKQLLKGTIDFTKTEKGWVGETNALSLAAITKK